MDVDVDVAINRVNAAFVVLLQNKDLHEMRKTMRLLEQTFNSQHGYPYVFLNNVPFTDHFKTHIQAMTKAKVHFGKLASITKHGYRQKREIFFFQIDMSLN